MKKIPKELYLFLYIISPLVSLAQTITIPNPTNAGSSIMEVLTKLITVVVEPVAAVLVVIYIIYAGFTFVTAQGKEKEITAAKSRLLWALIGAGILLGAAGIAEVVRKTATGLLTF